MILCLRFRSGNVCVRPFPSLCVILLKKLVPLVLVSCIQAALHLSELPITLRSLQMRLAPEVFVIYVFTSGHFWDPTQSKEKSQADEENDLSIAASNL